jgi:hypothetical protein
MTHRDVERIRFVTRHFNELQGLREGVPMGLLLLSQGLTMFFPRWPLMLLQFAIIAGAAVLILGSGPYYRRTFGEVERRPDGLVEDLSVYSPAGPALAVERRSTKSLLRVLSLALLACALVFLLRAIFPSALLMTDGSGVDPWVQLHPPVVEVTEQPAFPRSWSELTPVLAQGMYALFGACFLGIWLLRERRLSQSYYLALGGLLLGLATLGACLGIVLPELWKLGAARLADPFLLPLAHFWMALIFCGAASALAGLLDHWQIARVLRPVEEAA